ncbi:alpha-ribazole phosphatase [Anaerosolibacter carboniphilus]|uniref:Alpha-ribazole phosphatase n=1 Tax=Anaerosolibacter carboniphilus TaxID=1417629 RepID=A0A841KR47_9FIRM|nr:alpha-ribazole phosphatase [Anaerosolibacter carboniphilus]MBB6214608.1 alpha-ribazole phosphatase [Anaerosolibacter carboniphilus]
MLELYLVRHGETISNCRGVYCGWLDIPLTDKGIHQAEESAEKMKEVSLDVMITSDLLRTRKTAEIINKHHHIEIKNIDSFREMNFGLWEGLSYEEIINQFPDELNAWEKEWLNYPVPEGESLRQMYERVIRGIEKLIEDHPKGRILLVSHGGCIRGILSHLIGRGIEDYWKYKVENCGITKIEIVDGYPVLTMLNG